MTSEIDKLKHFHVENYSGTNFTDDLNDGEEFLYTTIRCKDDKEVTLLCKYVKNKHIGNCPVEDVTVELEKEAYEEMRHNI